MLQKILKMNIKHKNCKSKSQKKLFARFSRSAMPRNDLAILRTKNPILEFQQLYLPICAFEIPPRERYQEVLGACGMGKQNTTIRGPIATPFLKGLLSRDCACVFFLVILIIGLLTKAILAKYDCKYISY